MRRTSRIVLVVSASLVAGFLAACPALLWLWRVDRIAPDRWDVLGAAVTLVGMAIIAFGPHAR